MPDLLRIPPCPTVRTSERKDDTLRFQAVNGNEAGSRREDSGKVEGITSDAKADLAIDVAKAEHRGLAAILEYYGAETDEGRHAAEQKASDAYKEARSAEARQQRLQESQDEHQAKRQEVADWAKAFVG